MTSLLESPFLTCSNISDAVRGTTPFWIGSKMSPIKVWVFPLPVCRYRLFSVRFSIKTNWEKLIAKANDDRWDWRWCINVPNSDTMNSCRHISVLEIPSLNETWTDICERANRSAIAWPINGVKIAIGRTASQMHLAISSTYLKLISQALCLSSHTKSLLMVNEMRVESAPVHKWLWCYSAPEVQLGQYWKPAWKHLPVDIPLPTRSQNWSSKAGLPWSDTPGNFCRWDECSNQPGVKGSALNGPPACGEEAVISLK